MDALTPNNQKAPDFTLNDLDGHPHCLADYQGRIVILNFWSAECPWAQAVDQELAAHLVEWGEAVTLLPVASNANEPLTLLVSTARERRLPLVLHDADHRVADLYGAQTTPEFFVIDPNGILCYHGAFNDVTFRQRIPTRTYLPQAVAALLAGRSPEPAQTSLYGCAIVRQNIAV
jgi:peroxiredoxin